MWIMLWVSMSAGGVLTSGAVEFPSVDACEAGRKSWGQMAIGLTEKVDAIVRLDAKCIRRETGKP